VRSSGGFAADPRRSSRRRQSRWIEERLSGMQEVLERRTERSGLLLRALLGKIQLDPTKGEIGRPYFVARTSLDTLALLAPPPGQDGPDGGSNSLRWWRRRESNPPLIQ
jgi:hypothetical protein